MGWRLTGRSGARRGSVHTAPASNAAPVQTRDLTLIAPAFASITENPGRVWRVRNDSVPAPTA